LSVESDVDVGKVMADSRPRNSWQPDGVECWPAWPHEENQLHRVASYGGKYSAQCCSRFQGIDMCLRIGASVWKIWSYDWLQRSHCIVWVGDWAQFDFSFIHSSLSACHSLVIWDTSK